MKGIAGLDEGQLGIVTNRSRVMVDVTFAHPSGEGTQTKKKQPCSLVLLEPGLDLVQDAHGTVWVRAIPPPGPPTDSSLISRTALVKKELIKEQR